MKKRITAMVMALLMMVSLLPAGMAKAAKNTASDLGNPHVSRTLGKTVWDCIYFGNYWQTKYVPVNEPEGLMEDKVCTDEDGNTYLSREDGSCYLYEPIKWRILSISGTDAFVMADKSLDFRRYHDTELETQRLPEADWASCELRSWLNDSTSDKGFMAQAFTEKEQKAIMTTTVENEANPWSDIEGGDDTEDKVYLLSAQEAVNVQYGFSSDPAEGVSRLSSNTDYASEGGTLFKKDDASKYNTDYWLRSPGTSEYHPCYVGHWLDAEILTEPSVLTSRQVEYKCVRPVMHIDLSDTSLWSYAGKVTPEGTVVEEPKEEVTAPQKPVIKSVKRTKANTAKLTLKEEVPDASGYQVQYALNRKFTGAKKRNFNSVSVTINGLSKKTYYFRVRAYIDNDGKAVYGKWSSVKKAAVKGASAAVYNTSDDNSLAVRMAGKVKTIPYDTERSFSEGLAAVCVGESWSSNCKWGFIDKNGKEVIKPKYDSVSDFSEGLAAVKKGKNYMYIDKSGKVVFNLKTRYDVADSDFSEGLALVYKDDKYGFIDKEGNEVVEPKYDYAEYFSEGLAYVRIGDFSNGKGGYIDKEGNEVIKLKYDEAGSFSEGLAPVKKGKKYGYIDKNGKVVIKFKYDYAAPFSEGLGLVRKGDKYGYVNNKGKVVVKLKYDNAESYSEGLAVVEKGGKYSFLDKKGKEKIKVNYPYAGSFSEGLALICVADEKTGELYGYINKKGKVVIKPKYYYAEPFSGGLAVVGEDGRIRFIDKKGKEVLMGK